jgi:hypothetical protein
MQMAVSVVGSFSTDPIGIENAKPEVKWCEKRSTR